jgi:[protein-PII] uridylyltransferase
MLLNEILLRNLRLHAIPPLPAEPTQFNERFAARNGLLLVRDGNLFDREPGAILEAFLMLEQHPDLAGMTAVTLRALWRALPRIDAAFRRDPNNRELFLQLLREPHGITHEFRRMNKYGVLGRYIPAFGRIVGQMQHDLFHVYTVDEHILMVLRNMRRFTVPEFAHEFPLCSRLISSFQRPEVLYLAALFHDIAKGRGGDHSTLGARDARRFCRLHGLSREDTTMVGWLVENHLVMSQTAQMQDLSDPDVVKDFARKVRDMRHLTALYLLTVADIRGTSPKVWNAWKGKLLEDLYRLTRQRLQSKGGNQESFLEERQKEALRIFRLYALSDEAHAKLWRNFDDSYFLRHDAQEIAWHTRCLFHRHDTGKPIARARLSPHGAGIQVLIYTPDQECLFARICGFFERNDYNIAEAKIYTTRHGYALDTFVVLAENIKDVHYRDLLNFVEYELVNTLASQAPLAPPASGRLSRQLKHFPIEPQVHIRPDDKGLYYILSVVAGDRTGLLSRIAQTLVKHGMSLHNAKIATLGQRAEDTFLINGPGLADAKIQLRLEQDLLDALRT